MSSIHPIRSWRKERGITLAKLAARVGVTPSHLSEIERGDGLSLELAGKLSQATTEPDGTVAVTVDDIERAKATMNEAAA